MNYSNSISNSMVLVRCTFFNILIIWLIKVRQHVYAVN